METVHGTDLEVVMVMAITLEDREKVTEVDLVKEAEAEWVQ